MEINKHVAFSHQRVPELLEYLEMNGIKHNKSEITCGFDILESSEHWPYIHQICEAKNLHCLTETQYTKEELADAQWLTMRRKTGDGSLS